MVKATIPKEEPIKISVSMHRELHRELLMVAFENDISVQDLVVEAINSMYLNNSWEGIKTTKTRLTWKKKNES